MKKLLSLLTLITISITTAQNFQTVEEVNDVCNQLGFASDEDAKIVVDEILGHIGLNDGKDNSFKIQECPNINNAIAKILEDERGNKVRYILYSSNFFNKIRDRASSDWAATSILAHEIGHHLNGHALNDQGSTHKFELEADMFSGFVLARMGASLKQAQSAIQTLRYEKATATHPAKADRLIAVKKGWEKATGKKVKITDYTLDEEDLEAEEYYRKGKEFSAKGEYEDAIFWLKYSAEKGNPLAMYDLGIMYDKGRGISADNHQGKYWYKKALMTSEKLAEKGNADGMYILGHIYERGSGVSQDYKQAEYWYKKASKIYEKAAEKGDTNAMFKLGILYFRDYGVFLDFKQTIYWFKKAAEKGDERAIMTLGFMYEEGLGVTKNITTAIKYYQMACDKGDKDGCDDARRLR